MFGVDAWVIALIFGVLIGRECRRAENRLQLHLTRNLRSLKKAKELLDKKMKAGEAKQLTERYEWFNKETKSCESKRKPIDSDRASGYGALNVWQESAKPGVTMATTRCELTDAIFAAADQANIVPHEFFQELERKKHELILPDDTDASLKLISLDDIKVGVLGH